MTKQTPFTGVLESVLVRLISQDVDAARRCWGLA